jgi:hypothetical protein
LSVQGAQVDRFQAVAIGGDLLGDAGDGPGVGGSFAVRRLKMLTSMLPFVTIYEAARERTNRPLLSLGVGD